MGNLASTKTSKLEKLRMHDKADDEEEYGDEAGGLTSHDLAWQVRMERG